MGELRLPLSAGAQIEPGQFCKGKSRTGCTFDSTAANSGGFSTLGSTNTVSVTVSDANLTTGSNASNARSLFLLIYGTNAIHVGETVAGVSNGTAYESIAAGVVHSEPMWDRQSLAIKAAAGSTATTVFYGITYR